jgi:3-dehydroquinate synthetase
MNAVAASVEEVPASWTLDCDVDRKLLVQMADGLSTGESPALGELLDAKRVFVLTTPTVDRNFGEAFRQLLISADIQFSWNCLALSEERKSLASVELVCRSVQEFGLDRKGVLLALGGGVCSDIVTLSATLVRRGVQHIRVPTTLLGQVDAGIGLKGGVNFGGHKNYLGCFYPPSTALIDVSYLRTLTCARIREGLAEILKMALVADRALFDVLRRSGTALESRFQAPALLGRRIVERSIELMLKELQDNPYENRAAERLADMGHTFSPALETASGYRLTHGEAVAIDMAFTCIIAERLGMMSARESEAFITLLSDVGLPINSPFLTPALCEHAMQHAAAHRGGRLNMVTPTAIGSATFLGIEALPREVLADALDVLQKRDVECAVF